MSEGFSVNTWRVEGFEGFREAVHGSHVDVMQLQRGHLRGALTHISIGDDFSLSVGSFSVGIRAQRTSSDPKLIVGMLLASENRVTHWSYDMHPGDVLVIPPGVEHDGRFHGGASYAAARFDLADVASVFGGEARMSDPATWSRKNRIIADESIGPVAVERLRAIVGRLSDPAMKLSAAAADYWRRSIIDTLAVVALNSLPADTEGALRSATRLVREVEHYIDTAGTRPVHISEICVEFGVSRRSLHRAFDETLGVGPITFMQRKRLCNVHSALRSGDPSATTIAEVAMQHGFLNLGRFSGYFRALFDEYPSETFGKAPPFKRRSNADGSRISRASHRKGSARHSIRDIGERSAERT